jgi:hypothetical protein
MTRSRRFVALALLALAVGCASSGASAGKQNPNVITTEEIGQSTASTAYELIQRLRPNYLRTRGAVHGSPTASGENRLETVDLVVYLNENRLGGTDQLRQMPISEIREIRYYSASEATTKWGTGHSAGAIQVVSR